MSLTLGQRRENYLTWQRAWFCPTIAGQSSCPTKAADGSKVMPDAVSTATSQGLRFASDDFRGLLREQVIPVLCYVASLLNHTYPKSWSFVLFFN